MRPGKIKIRDRMRSAPRAQRGMVAILMLLILIVGGTYFLLGHLGQSKGRIESEKKTAEALAKAKEALIAWAVANQTTPGMFPYPDRNLDGNYDGMSDCPGGAVTSALLIGKLPVVSPVAPCIGGVVPLALDFTDGSGEVLWYAVSRNMVATNTTAPVINPDIRDNPTYPWLVVRDRNGNPIPGADRVAAVIIAPGSPLQVPGFINQTRTGATPAATQFLEGIPGSASNADFDGANDVGPCSLATVPPMCEDFVMSEPYAIPPPPPPALPNPIIFNDRLIYITIDELMPQIEKRVAREIRQRLVTYYNTPANRYYPPAATTRGGVCDPTGVARVGFMPVTCGVPFGVFPPPVIPFPAWYANSSWQNFFYYAISARCVSGTALCGGAGSWLTVGAQANVQSVVISVGRQLNGTTCSNPPPPTVINQDRTATPNNVCSYLDSDENTNPGDVFTAVGQPLTGTFNDQSVIVGP